MRSTGWVGAVVLVVLAGSAGVAVWLYDRGASDPWVAPVTVAVGLATAGLAALAAVGSSRSAFHAERTARQALEALRLHHRPRLILKIRRHTSGSPEYLFTEGDLAPPVRDLRVTWLNGAERLDSEAPERIDGTPYSAPGELSQPGWSGWYLTGVTQVEVTCVDVATSGRWLARVEAGANGIECAGYELAFRMREG